MNKLLKGSIAGAAGVALLLGGAGTFALWNDSANLDGGTIVAGNLAIEPSETDGSWTVNNGDPRPAITGYKIVPGDVLVYTQEMDITATGDNLEATLSIGEATIAPTTPGVEADEELADYLVKEAVLTASGEGIARDAGVYTVTAETAGDPQTASVAITITFPKDPLTGAENATKLGSVNLEGLAVTLTQN